MVILICLFSISLINQMWWISRALVTSKKSALNNIDEHIQMVRNGMKKDVSTFSTFINLVSFREKVQKASALAFDLEVLSQFFMAVFFPLVGGAFIQIILERFIELAI